MTLDIKSFEEYAELKSKLSSLEEENKKLKELFAGEGREMLSNGNTYKFDENISTVQLAKLNEISMTRELTLEEAKKCEIYSKILNGVKKNVKDVDAEIRNLDTTKLLENISG